MRSEKRLCDGSETFIQSEVLIDAQAASFLLKLPLYWFKNPRQRGIYRIPHYMFYKLVRFKPSEIMLWAKEFGQSNFRDGSAVSSRETPHA